MNIWFNWNQFSNRLPGTSGTLQFGELLEAILNLSGKSACNWSQNREERAKEWRQRNQNLWTSFKPLGLAVTEVNPIPDYLINGITEFSFFLKLDAIISVASCNQYRVLPEVGKKGISSQGNKYKSVPLRDNGASRPQHVVWLGCTIGRDRGSDLRRY